MSESTKRRYKRRSDEERIQELQSRIESLQAKIEARKRKDSPVLKEIPKVQKRLQKFSQMALDYGRHDIANTTTAFIAGLDRIYNDSLEQEIQVAVEDEEDDAL